MRLNRVTVISMLAEKNMQKKELAERSGVTRNTISAVCNGKSCSKDTAQKIARALDVDIKKLLVNG